MEDGQLGFSIDRKKDCMEPNYDYQNGGANGYIHIRSLDEFYEKLLPQLEGMTVPQFKERYNIENDFGKTLILTI